MSYTDVVGSPVPAITNAGSLWADETKALLEANRTNIETKLQKVLESCGIYPPSERGYGQPTSDSVAQELLNVFNITEKEHT